MKQILIKDMIDWEEFCKTETNAFKQSLFLISRFHGISMKELEKLPVTMMEKLQREMDKWVNQSAKTIEVIPSSAEIRKINIKPKPEAIEDRSDILDL